jgi:uncharacterized protein (TIGR02118 family)
MFRATVLYPKTDESHFDMDYYLNKHVPLLLEKLTGMGLVRVEIDKGIGGAAPGQPPPYAVIFDMVFESIEALQKGLGAHGEALMKDTPNFTNVEPLVQISRVVR